MKFQTGAEPVGGRGNEGRGRRANRGHVSGPQTTALLKDVHSSSPVLARRPDLQAFLPRGFYL